jgi:crotonobetainyl-CoA:carnitine CoA-transferase CaiB-like acyl-CoA transferase
MTTQLQAQAPLSGVRVIEWADGLACSLSTRLLADLGADIVKVEPSGGSAYRRLRPCLVDHGVESSTVFAYCNIGKRSVTLDVGRDGAQPVFDQLIGQADVFVYDAPANTQAELHLAESDLCVAHPDLVVLNITPYGLSGPYADWAACSLTLCHHGGEGANITDGLDDSSRPPIRIAGHVPHYDAGYAGAIAVLAALFSGQGDYIELSEFEVQLSLNTVEIPRHLNEGLIDTRETQPLRYNIVTCADGVIDVTNPVDAAWELLRAKLGDPDWMADERFGTRELRGANRPALNTGLETWSASCSCLAAQTLLQECGIAAEKVQTIAEVIGSSQYAARDFFRTFGDTLLPMLPFLVDGRRCGPQSLRVPGVGEHTNEVFQTELGLSTEILGQVRPAHAGQ